MTQEELARTLVASLGDQLANLIASARAEERERCAFIAERAEMDAPGDDYADLAAGTARRIANAIRKGKA